MTGRVTTGETAKQGSRDTAENTVAQRARVRKPKLINSKHDSHNWVVRPVSNYGPHKYQRYCLDCEKHIQWTTKAVYDAYLEVRREAADELVASKRQKNHSH